uniref:Movement protein n=1 Tax=Caenorhabditis tropicalis TaxID=1561998 RepID=A0A1I7UYI7_9PELO
MTIISIVRGQIKARRIGPVTRSPVIPFSMNNYTLKEGRNGTRFFVGEPKDIRGADNSDSLTLKLYSLVLATGRKDPVPPDARVISIRMDGFKYGTECHQFIPFHRSPRESYYTYQMFGDQKIQATFYVENEISYLAGICIYVENSMTFEYNYRKKIMKDLMKLPKYLSEELRIQENESSRLLETRPPIEHPDSSFVDDIPTENWKIKYCNRFERDVMTTCFDESVYHKEWNTVVKRWITHKCIHCLNHLDLPPSYDSLPNV